MLLSSLILTVALAVHTLGTPIEKRASMTENELNNGVCRDVTFIMARGSTEMGNMGSTVGPPTCQGLKDTLGADKVACQGVGGGYMASIMDNVGTTGTSRAGVAEGTKMINLANTQCPQTKIVVAGYSQGAALIAAVLSALDPAVQSKVTGAVLYGYTKNQQNNGKIPNYPAGQTKVFCAATDGVCGGGLLVTPGHLTYTANVREAVKFLVGTL